MMAFAEPVRVAAIAGAMAMLTTGLYAGLVRLGWSLPAIPPHLVMAHGPIMVTGFFGTLIGLERAVAARSRAAYLGPVGALVAGILVAVGAPSALAAAFACAGSAAVLALYASSFRLFPPLVGAGMCVATFAWLAGNTLWLLGLPYAQVVPFWMAFLVLTIAAERLELSRALRPSRARTLGFVLALMLASAALVVTPWAPDAGVRALGVALIVIAAWLVRWDAARRTIRIPGLPRFVAACILSGAAWLALGGVLLADLGAVPAGPQYDAALHAVFVGFVFAMVFGHAPIVLPAVLGRAMRFSRSFYVHLAFLQASLVVRVVGDLGGWMDLRRMGGMLNAMALLVFIGSTVRGLRRGTAVARDARVPDGPRVTAPPSPRAT